MADEVRDVLLQMSPATIKVMIDLAAEHGQTWSELVEWLILEEADHVWGASPIECNPPRAEPYPEMTITVTRIEGELGVPEDVEWSWNDV